MYLPQRATKLYPVLNSALCNFHCTSREGVSGRQHSMEKFKFEAFKKENSILRHLGREIYFKESKEGNSDLRHPGGNLALGHLEGEI